MFIYINILIFLTGSWSLLKMVICMFIPYPRSKVLNVSWLKNMIYDSMTAMPLTFEVNYYIFSHLWFSLFYLFCVLFYYLFISFTVFRCFSSDYIWCYSSKCITQLFSRSILEQRRSRRCQIFTFIKQLCRGA